MTNYAVIPDPKPQPPPETDHTVLIAVCVMAAVIGFFIGLLAAHAQNPSAEDAAHYARSDYPDKKLTPGATRVVDMKTLCTAGSTKDARHVTEAEKKQVFERYGFKKGTYKPGDFEIDHFVSLELGGSNDITNLWAEHYSEPWGARQKDVVETTLHHCVCTGAMSLEAAQATIKGDWIAAYKSIKAGNKCNEGENHGSKK